MPGGRELASLPSVLDAGCYQLGSVRGPIMESPMSRILLALGLLCTLPAFAAEPGEVTAQVKAQFAKRLKVEISDVRATPVPGLYEVIADGQVIYMSEDGRYAVQGALLDLEERRNLTEESQGKIRLAAFSALPEGSTLDFPAKGEQKHTMFVFTDVDCGYCRKLHQEVPALNEAGVTVRYLAYPRGGLDSPAFKVMQSVWCSDDRQTALTTAKGGGNIEEKSCESPVKAQFELGNRLGVQGTPTIILESGKELGGYAPAAQIVEMLNQQ